MAGKYGIQDQSVLNALMKGDVGEGMQQYGNIAGSFGLDPDEASKNAREFSNAYDHLAEDLKAIQGKIADNFFKPLTTAMTGLSSMLEGNGDKVTVLGTAFEALALAMSLRVIPPLLKITGLLDLLKAPVWLLRLLGVGSATAGAAAGAALLASTEPLNAGEPALGPDGRLHQLDPDGKPTGAALSGPWDGKTRGGGRAALGRRVGTQSDKRNWWQRTMPKVLGGQDGPSTPGASDSSMNARGMEAMRYLVEEKGWEPAAAAIAVGNAQQESGIQSTGRPGDPNTPGGSHYMFQWNNGRNNDTVNGRRARYEAFAAARGKSPTDFYTSLDFMDEERKGMSKLSGWDKENDLSNAGDISRAYEGYGDHSTGTRVANANGGCVSGGRVNLPNPRLHSKRAMSRRTHMATLSTRTARRRRTTLIPRRAWSQPRSAELQ